MTIRVAGIQAPDYENAEPCRTRRAGYVCSDRFADRSRAIVTRMVLRRTLTCWRPPTQTNVSLRDRPHQLEQP